MKGVYRVLRVIAAYCVGALIAMVSFGLMLGLVWSPMLPQSSFYRLASLLLVSGLATLAGGFGIGLSVEEKRTFHAAIFGLGFGLVGSTYTLGLDPTVLGYALATSLLALAGGFISSRLTVKVRRLPRHGAA